MLSILTSINPFLSLPDVCMLVCQDRVSSVFIITSCYIDDSFVKLGPVILCIILCREVFTNAVSTGQSFFGMPGALSGVNTKGNHCLAG